MALHDTDALIIETATTAESLPDPTTVTGRSNLLSNTGTAAVVWSSSGATPFSVGGMLIATVSIPAGQSLAMQSDGTHWVAKSSGQRQFAAGTAVSVAGGIVNVVFPVPFAVAPIVQGQVLTPAGNPAPFYLNLTAVTTTTATFEVRNSAAVTVALLGLTILLGSTASVGTTIQWIATQPGATP